MRLGQGSREGNEQEVRRITNGGEIRVDGELRAGGRDASTGGMDGSVQSKRMQMGEKDRRTERGQGVRMGRKLTEGGRGQSRKEKLTNEERLQKRWREGGNTAVLRRGTELREAKGKTDRKEMREEVMTGHLCTKLFTG